MGYEWSSQGLHGLIKSIGNTCKVYAPHEREQEVHAQADQPNCQEIEPESGFGHLWDRNEATAENNGIGWRGNGEHEGEGRRDCGRNYQAVGMNANCHSYSSQHWYHQSRCSGIGRDFGQEDDSQCHNRNHGKE